MKKTCLVAIVFLVICLFSGLVFACETEKKDVVVPPKTGDIIAPSDTKDKTDNSTPDNSISDIVKPLTFGVDFLKDCSVDIQAGDLSLGVERIKIKPLNVEQIDVKPTPSNEEIKEKGYLVAFDKNNKLRYVTFAYKGATIKQEEIKAHISNLYVTKTFTYVTFVSENISYDYDYNYNYERFTAESAFPVDEDHQSFVIDNNTNKLYPTNEIGKIYDIKENFVKRSDGRYHKLSIVDEKLNVSVAILNPNINVLDVLVDKYGQVYARTNALNGTYEGVIFYTEDNKFLGDDDRVYQVGASNSSIKYYDASQNLSFVENNITVRVGDNYLIKNNTLYSTDSFSSAWLDYYHMQNGVLKSHDSYYDGNDFIIAGGDLYLFTKLSVGKLYVFDTKINTLGDIIGEYTTISKIGANLILTKEEFDGTKKYLVTGKTLKLFMDVTYQNTIITVQPLN